MKTEAISLSFLVFDKVKRLISWIFIEYSSIYL